MTTRKYDITGNLIQETEVVTGEQLIQQTSYKYDEKNREIEKHSEFVDGTSVTKTTIYDDNDLTTQSTSSSSDGEVIATSFRKVDENGTVLEESDFDIEDENYKDGNDTEIAFRTVNIPNEAGKPAESLMYNMNGDLIERMVTHYDEYGNEVEYLRYDAMDNPSSRSVYVCDEQGRTIEEAAYAQSGRLTYYRRYEYEVDEHYSETRTLNKEGRILEQHCEQYDPETRIRIVEIYHTTDNPTSITETHYDEDGDVIEMWENLHAVYEYYNATDG
jgi:hypothetical protein